MINPSFSVHEWSRVRSAVVGGPHGLSQALVSWLRLLPPPLSVSEQRLTAALTHSAAQVLGDQLWGSGRP